ncbi:Chromo domain/shadow [Penicillium italicum]|uniref:Chromo domain/shadow n=1 Tax=Penicillium italicum TaxID=40296 RepID=A0A0A2KN04_PENIT|nr:Chromo domain/shadow [Penicillium italicum]
MPPPVDDMSDEESGDIPFREAPEANGNDEQDSPKDEGDEEEGEEEEEGLYVVEDILEHAWLDDGTLKLWVKWKGYDKISDRTWEEEDGLMDGARDIVTAYYKRIGGRPKKDDEKPATEKPGRKRKSMGSSKLAKASPAPAASEAKRQRRKSVPKETKQASPSSEENGTQWLPKGKNWDKDVKEVDTIVREGDAGLMAWLEFNNGHKAKLSVQACYEKCPLKMLKFYESHLVFKDN